MNKFAARNSEFQMIEQTLFKKKQLTRKGFTLLELLVVTAMIILLLGILIVALNRTTKTAQSTNTRALMTSISQALVRFQGDIGYLPPLLDVDRNLIYPLELPSNTYAEDMQQWYSVTSLAEYLLGYGNDKHDAYGGLGLRDPGPDGVWGATVLGSADGTLGARNFGAGAASAGKIYGPYLELKDDHLIGSINGDEDNVSLPGEGTYNSGYPKVILDYWGQPIRYYRRVYRQGGLKYPYRPDPNDNNDFLPTLADVFVLRPYDLDPGSATDSPINDYNTDITGANGRPGDTTTSFELKTAAFALFSKGPNRFYDQTVRFDADQNNEDNVVEVGQ